MSVKGDYVVFLSSLLISQNSACALCFSFCGWWGLSRGGRGDLRPAFPRSAWLIGKRKWGHGSALESFSSLILVVVDAVVYACGAFIVLHVPLTVEWESVRDHSRLRVKRPHFHLYSWLGLDLNDFIGCRVVLRDEACFIAGPCPSQ